MLKLELILILLLFADSNVYVTLLHACALFFRGLEDFLVSIWGWRKMGSAMLISGCTTIC